MKSTLISIGLILLVCLGVFLIVFLPLWFISSLIFFFKVKLKERKERKQYDRGDYGL